MPINEKQMLAIMPLAKSKVGTFLAPLNAAMLEFDINTPLRQAAFLAQIGYESGQLAYTKELASGVAYEGRKDLGNTVPGDGVKFKGRGLIQITGRANYQRCGDALKIDLIGSPQVLEYPVEACRSAGWFWQAHGLNELADEGKFEMITRIINGGLNGLTNRVVLYDTARKVLAC